MNRFGQVCSSLNRSVVLFFLDCELHTLQIVPSQKTCVQFFNRTSLPYLARNSAIPRGGGNSPSSRCSWCKVSTGVKGNFSSAYLHELYVVRKLSISQVRMCIFPRIQCKTTKLWLSLIPTRRQSGQPGLRPPKKVGTTNFSSPHFDERYVVVELSTKEAFICSFSRMGKRLTNYSSLNFCLKT